MDWVKIILFSLTGFLITVVVSVFYFLGNMHETSVNSHGYIDENELLALVEHVSASPDMVEDTTWLDALNDAGWRIGEDFSDRVDERLENVTEESVIEFFDGLNLPEENPINSLRNVSLQNIVVTPEECSGYDRDIMFGSWIDTDYDSLNTRDEVLVDERNLDGTWTSLYDNLIFSDSSMLDIDHVVPVREAFCSGSNTFWVNGTWDYETAEKFYNDLTADYSLIAVSANSNRSKSDSDPSEWLPDFNTCQYVEMWVAVKNDWNLTMDIKEFETVNKILNEC